MKALTAFALSTLFLTSTVHAATGRAVSIVEEQSARDAYEKGFVRDVMRAGTAGVGNWDRTLIQNDAPGAGSSNKGNFMEPLYGSRMIRKVLTVEEPLAREAFVVVVFFSDLRLEQRKYPLVVTVNGNTTSYRHANRELYVYVPVNPSWLRKGENEIILSCPEAKTAEDGWTIYLARADEYAPGGGDPRMAGAESRPDRPSFLIRGARETAGPSMKVGDRSFLSTDGGKKWSIDGKGLHPRLTDMFGTETSRDIGGVVGEYCVRLNLRQYRPEGTLISPVIDLWSEPGKDMPLVPFTEVEKLRIAFRGAAPGKTDIAWEIRAGVTMDPLDGENWTEWIPAAAGPSADVELRGRFNLPPTHWDPERALTLPKVRYMQWRAILRTRDPLATPTVEKVTITRDVTRRMDIPGNIIITDHHNPDILYSSTGFTYQSADEPMNREVKERDDLDKVIEGAASEFDAIVRLLDYASRRWVYAGPRLEYPKWNTIDISERAHSFGDGGMCIQYAAYLVHILTVMGFQAHHVNIIAHEVVEVWSDDFDKWVYLDPTQGVDCYLFDTKTGVPLGLNDMHTAYYELYGVKKPIDWMKPDADRYTLKKDYSRLPIALSTTDPRIMLRHEKSGMLMYYDLCAFLRMMPRNDFSTTSVPEPLQQGNYCPWPWDGYVNWYDELAPPKLQYSNHTDRACDFWPSLNRVRFEAVPEINGDAVFIRMITFTPSFETFEVRVNGGAWTKSDGHYTWRLASGKNRLDMRAKSRFGVAGPPSFIECMYTARPIPKPVDVGSMNQ